MDEYRRQAYLEALGLEQYTPRWLLPLAPEPRTCTWPVAIRPGGAGQSAQPETLSQPEVPESAQPRAAMRQLEEGFRAPTEALSELAPEAREPLDAQSAQTPLPFSLSIWRSPLPLLVLDTRQPRSAMPTERLAANLLGAIARVSGWALERNQIREESFAWPSVHNPAVPLSAADARAELEAWLEADLGRQPARHLLLMGESAARYLLPQGQSYADCLWQALELADFSPPALVTPSLLELLQEPMLKRRLWLSLQSVLPSLLNQ